MSAPLAPHTLVSTVAALFRATLTARGDRKRASRGMLKSMQAQLGDAPCVPVGDGDEKTASPGTYRPVGDSCPASCSYLGNGCYAQGGHVNLHQMRAAVDRIAAVNGAAIAMVWARQTDRVARLHVSGDFGQTVDLAYIDALCAVADAVNAHSGAPLGSTVAWTYTHHVPGPWVARLAAHGVHVRASDRAEHNGVIVARFADVPALRRTTGARIAKCPAQLRKTTCADCRLCWERKDLVIAFDPHGGSANRAADASPVRA